MTYRTVTEHHKVYPWTDVMASPYNCDNAGTLDCAAAIESIKAYQSNEGVLYFPQGTYLIADDLVIPVGMEVICHGIFSVATGKTLTINGPFEAEIYQVFSGAGTVVFGAGAIKEAYPEWWATNTTPGTTDMTAAFAAAASSGAKVVRLQATSYAVDSILITGYNLVGPGKLMCTIYGNGSDNTIQVGNGTTQDLYLNISGFTVSHANNTAGTDIAAIKAIGITQCLFDDIQIVCKSGVTKYGFWGTYIGADKGFFSNRITSCRVTGASFDTERGWYFEGIGDGTGNPAANVNYIENTFANNCAYGFYVKNGHNNVFSQCKVNAYTGSDSAVAAKQLYAWAFEDSNDSVAWSPRQCQDNALVGCSFDSLPHEKKILLIRNHDTVAATAAGKSKPTYGNHFFNAIGCRALDVNFHESDTILAIEGFTAASPTVVSWTDHGMATGDTVKFRGITQADWSALNEEVYRITVINDDSFSLVYDSSAFAAYNAGTDPGTIRKMCSAVTMQGETGTGKGIKEICSYSIYGNGGTMSGGERRDQMATNYENRALVCGNEDDKGYLTIAQSPVAYNRMVLSGQLATATNAVRPGGVGLIYDDTVSTADVRIAYTADGTAATAILTIDKNSVGTATITTGNTSVDVTNTRITSSSRIIVTASNAAAQAAGVPYVSLSAGSKFTITSASATGGNATYNYLILRY